MCKSAHLTNVFLDRMSQPARWRARAQEEAQIESVSLPAPFSGVNQS